MVRGREGEGIGGGRGWRRAERKGEERKERFGAERERGRRGR